MTIALALFATLALTQELPPASYAATSHHATQEQVATVKEPESGHLYDVTQPVLGGDSQLSLTGTGIREKTIFAVNVYSYGLYIDSKKARELLAKWQGKKAKELQKDDAFYTALMDDAITKELRIKFCRNVDADDVRSAFEDSLAPRILEYKKDEKGTKEEKLAVLEEFRKLFTLDKVKDGNVLRFAWHPGGKLHSSINGEVQAVIESKALCWALFDVYLGKKPISSGGKKRLVERIPELIAAVAAPADKR
ncbi:MAG: chalcone isomerase family protein [Planctomycetota bacterium]